MTPPERLCYERIAAWLDLRAETARQAALAARYDDDRLVQEVLAADRASMAGMLRERIAIGAPESVLGEAS